MSFCPNCGAKVDDETAVFCVECGRQLRDLRPSATRSAPAFAPVSGEFVPEEVTLNWFQRHLGWTIVLTWFALRLGGVIVIVSLGPTMTPEAASAFNGFSYLVGIVVGSIVCGWVLRQKKRSLWWLLLIPVPFGWWVFLLLENKRVEP